MFTMFTQEVRYLIFNVLRNCNDISKFVGQAALVVIVSFTTDIIITSIHHLNIVLCNIFLYKK